MLKLKKFLTFPIAILLLASTVVIGSLSYAAVGVVVNNSTQLGAAGNVNVGGNVNWSYDGFNLNMNGINWNNVQLFGQSLSGVNWQSIDTNTGSINWINLGGQAVQGQIMCWNQTSGRPGKCVAISGTTCTTCN